MKELKKAQMGMIAVLAVMLVSIKRRLPVTRKLSSGTTTLALAGIVLLVVAGSASAATPIYGCQVINTDGVYVLMQDINDDTTNRCIDIQASDVIFDGNGYCINGIDTDANSYGIRAWNPLGGPRNNIIIKDVEVTNFDVGIGITGSDDSTKLTDVLVENCSVHDNGVTGGYGIHFLRVCDSTITRNDVYNQSGSGATCGAGGNGIYVEGSVSLGAMGRNNTVTCNHVHNNIKGGIYLKCAADYNNISYNYCYDNGESGHGATGGILVRCKGSNWNTITYNNVSDNFGDGIYCRGNNNTIKFNTAVGNSNAGIDMGVSPSGADGADNNEVSYNFAPVIQTCGGGPMEPGNCTGNSGVNNSCDTLIECGGTNSILCPFTCVGPTTSVYFDYDGDGNCSKAVADCSCIRGSCCNPGVFNASGYTDAYSAECPLKTQSTPGNDPDDCDKTIMAEDERPDLVIQDLAVEYLDGGANETHYNVSYKVCNIGGGPSVNSVARTTIDSTTQYDENIGVLAKGACSGIITVGPLAMSPDSDAIEVCADATNTNSDEISELNNCADATLVAKKPDLTITDVHTEWVNKALGTYNIIYTLENIGNATAPVSRTTVNIDGGSMDSPPDDNIPALAPNAKHTDRVVPGLRTISGDSDTIVLYADRAHSGDGFINEWNEGNNVGQGTIGTSLVITVKPPTSCVDGTFYVDIDVDPNGNQVYGVQYKLTYNPSVIYVVSQDEGTFLSHNGNNTAETNNVLNTVSGYSTYGLTRIDSLLGETTPGTLVRVKYTTVGSPDDTIWINLSEVVVSDQNAVELDSSLENGSVTICPANQPPDANCSVDHMYNNAGYGVTTFNGSESTDGADTLLNHFFKWQTHSANTPLLGMIMPDNYVSSCYNGTGYDPFEEVLYLTDSGGLMDTCTCDVIVYIAGDANGDCVVNILDASMTGLRWNKKCSDYDGVCWGMMLPTLPPQETGADMADRADLNNDCFVNVLDTSIVGLNWGNTC